MTYEQRLRAAAARRHGRVTPCAGRTWAECITAEGLWYNSEGGSTHIIQVMPQWKYQLLREYARR